MNSPKNELEQLIDSATSEVRTSKVEQPLHTERCISCGGAGCWHGRPSYPCFKCKGTGVRTFKQSHEKRAKSRAAKVQAKVNQEEASIEEFKAAHPAEYEWMVAASPKFEFASKMIANIRQWGSLTPAQLDACTRSAQKLAAAKQTAEAAAPAAADTAGIDRLKLAFDTAIANAKAKGLGLKMPRITIGGMTISPAKATSTNPGALYVKNAGEYIGKIQNGRFFGVRACTEAQEKQVLAFIADPNAAAKAYGTETGVCCICNATLTSKWRLRGIGPICAIKFGW